MFFAQQILIPHKRAEILLGDNGAMLEYARKRLGCTIEIKDGNVVSISGDAYTEYNAHNVITAFGRGFDMATSLKLLSEDYFFASVSLKDLFNTKAGISRIKSRIIGEKGKTKLYIEEVSGAHVSIYGSFISFIGTIDETRMARAAVEVIVNVGTHKKAYRIMEAMRRKLKESSMKNL